VHSRLGIIVALGLIASLFVSSLSAVAQDNFEYYPIATDEFETVWERTDYPVLQLEVARTWVWSPGGFTDAITEEYAEGEDGERLVQYFDKSRMEMPTLGAADPEDEESPWLITQGLLASELMTGRLQLGDDTFEQHQPSERSAAGDPGDVTAPTYAIMGEQMGRAPRTGDGPIVEHIDREGNITSDAARFAGYGVTDVDDAYTPVPGIDKNIASVFWDLMTSDGLVYEDGKYVEDQPIFLNPFYAVGYPLTDAFWADVMVDGVVQDVLIQAFERRVLTYTPGNPEGWETESGNIGQHYYNWRYHEIDREVPIEAYNLALEPEAENPYRSLAWLLARFDVLGIDAALADVDLEARLIAHDDVVADLVGELQEDGIITPDQAEAILTAPLWDLLNRHTVEGTVTVNDEPATDAQVQFNVTGVNEADGLVDVVDGTVSFTYRATSAGVDTITATVVGTDVVATQTKTWVAVEGWPVRELLIDPVSAQNEVGTEHTLEVWIELDGQQWDLENGDAEYPPVVEIERTFEGGVTETIHDADVEIVGGRAVITYTGPDESSQDVINVTVIHYGPPETVTATKNWVE
jgi:hypothetical protein